MSLQPRTVENRDRRAAGGCWEMFSERPPCQGDKAGSVKAENLTDYTGYTNVHIHHTCTHTHARMLAPFIL